VTTWIVSGTGTNVGKTHFSEALLLHLQQTGRSGIGWKPVETGVTPGTVGPDERALTERSARTPPPTLRFALPVSPSVAARAEGKAIDLDALYKQTVETATEGELVIELPGGLYSHLCDGLPNAAWVRRANSALVSVGSAPARLVLVAANRLGVLHDVGACLRAVAYDKLEIAAIVLMNLSSAADANDASLTENLNSMMQEPLLRNTFVCELPHGTPEAVAALDSLRSIAAR
jgi:dethiobiotin synthetase